MVSKEQVQAVCEESYLASQMRNPIHPGFRNITSIRNPM